MILNAITAAAARFQLGSANRGIQCMDMNCKPNLLPDSADGGPSLNFTAGSLRDSVDGEIYTATIVVQHAASVHASVSGFGSVGSETVPISSSLFVADGEASVLLGSVVSESVVDGAATICLFNSMVQQPLWDEANPDSSTPLVGWVKFFQNVFPDPILNCDFGINNRELMWCCGMLMNANWTGDPFRSFNFYSRFYSCFERG